MDDISDKMGKKPRLLLVDDDFTSLAFMSNYLQDYFILHAASDGEHALELITKYDYFGFLVDIKLGTGINGIELTEKLRGIERYKSVPILAVTAFFKPSEVKYLISKGFDDVIIKPFNKAMLLEKLHSQIFI